MYLNQQVDCVVLWTIIYNNYNLFSLHYSRKSQERNAINDYNI